VQIGALKMQVWKMRVRLCKFFVWKLQ